VLGTGTRLWMGGRLPPVTVAVAWAKARAGATGSASFVARAGEEGASTNRASMRRWDTKPEVGAQECHRVGRPDERN
jgi:hypothetical protein